MPQSFENKESSPSVRSLYGHSVTSIFELDLSFQPETSKITVIDLQQCSIPVLDIMHLLSRTRFLTHFTYDQRESLDLQGDHLANILVALHTYDTSTLESLCLTAKTSWTWCLGGTCRSGTLLKEFPALKEARLPVNLFLKDEAEYEGDDIEEDLKQWMDDIPRLIDSLPASIEMIEFDGETTMGKIESLLLDSDGRNQGLFIPNLTKIVFHEAIVETKTMKMMAKAWKEGLRAAKINLQL